MPRKTRKSAAHPPPPEGDAVGDGAPRQPRRRRAPDRAAALHSVTSFEGLYQPWDGLAARLGPMDVESLALGSVYLATARHAARA